MPLWHYRTWCNVRWFVCTFQAYTSSLCSLTCSIESLLLLNCKNGDCFSSNENKGYEYNKQYYASQGLLPCPWEVLKQLHSQSPELYLEPRGSNRKKNSWGVSLKTKSYSSQLQIWSRTTSLSKLSINESQLKAATKYCTPWLKTCSCYIPVTFQVWALMNQPLSPHRQRAFERSAEVNLMQCNFPLPCALALKLQAANAEAALM